MFILIGPHVRAHEIKTVWTTLQDRGFEPEPLPDCSRRHLSKEQIDLIIAALPNAPIKAPEDGQEFLMIRLRCKKPAARRILENALASSIKGTAKIPRWSGGRKLPRPVRLQEHPEAMLREIVIVPDEETMPHIESLFVNHEDPDIAA